MTRKLIIEFGDQSSMITGVSYEGDIRTPEVISASSGLLASILTSTLPEQESAIQDAFDNCLEAWKQALKESESKILSAEVEEFLRGES